MTLQEVKRVAQVLRFGALGVGVIGAVGLLGFISSIAFNLTLGRSSSFVSESVVDWLVWGVRALIAPLVYMALIAATYLILMVVWRVLSRAVQSIGRRAESLRSKLTLMRKRMGLDDPVVVAQCLFVAGFVALAGIWWRYADLIHAATNRLSEGFDPARQAALLGPNNIEAHISYGQALDVLVLILSVGCYRVYRSWKKKPARSGLVLLIATMTLIAAALLLLAFPYRILWHNEFERIDFEGGRAYILGSKDNESLIYCPESSAGTHHVVGDDDPRIHRLHAVESIFSQH